MFTAIAKALRNNILLGLALITPLVVTVFIIVAIFRFITNSAVFSLVERYAPEGMHDSGLDYLLLGMLSLLLVLMALFLIGFFIRSLLGKKLYRIAELLIERIPVINRIYVWVRQISESFLAQRQTLFKEVVLVQYPREGLWSMAFVTAPTAPVVTDALPTDDPMVSLFIPTTPNPTSGLMIIAPRSELRILDITVADAMKLIVSAGAVYPESVLTHDGPDLVDKLESWIGRETS